MNVIVVFFALNKQRFSVLIRHERILSLTLQAGHCSTPRYLAVSAISIVVMFSVVMF